MSTQHHIPSAAFSVVKRMIANLPPLKSRKDPQVARLCGLFLGGIGLGLYFGTWLDFFLPVGIWLAFLVLAAPTGELLFILAPFFTAMYGYHRAKTSNAKLQPHGGAERTFEAEVVMDVPPIPAARKDAFTPSAEVRLLKINDLFRAGILTQAEHDAKRRQILSEL